MLSKRAAYLFLTLLTLWNFRSTIVAKEWSCEHYSTMTLAAEASNHLFLLRLYNPLRATVTADTCLSSNLGREPDAMQVWVDLGYEYTSFDRNDSSKGCVSNGYEATVGIQTRLDSNWSVGSAFSYENSAIDYGRRAHGKTDCGLAGLYALYRPCGYYVLGDLVASYAAQKLIKNIN